MTAVKLGQALAWGVAILLFLVIAMIPLVWLARVIEALVWWEWGWIFVVGAVAALVWLAATGGE